MSSNDYHARIADLSDDDKPRERAMHSGVASLSNAELIAIALGSGLPGKSVIDLSREILGACGNNLDTLARMPIKEMSRRFKGVGPAKAVSLSAAIELGRRCAAVADGAGLSPVIRSSNDAYTLLKSRMQHLDHEEFFVIILNRANRVKSIERISSGGTSATVVDVKMVVKRAIDCLADGIILAHNHPSGALQPSTQDDHLTEKIKQAAAFADINVLDHIIVTTHSYYSYLDSGRM